MGTPPISIIEAVAALIERAKTDPAAERKTDALHCLLLNWQSERSRSEEPDPLFSDTAFACLVRFDRHETRMLDLIAGGAGVSPRAIVQRLAKLALFHPELQEAAIGSLAGRRGP